jgi:tetratricopeptide (TPR) repeat protein
VTAGAVANIINKTLNPFYTPYGYEAVETDYIAANYYLNVGRPDHAMKRAEKLTGDNAYKGEEMKAQIFFHAAMREPSDSAKSMQLARAEEAYKNSLKDNPEYVPALLGLGVVHYTQRNYTAALKVLQRCLSLDRNNAKAHLSIAQCYRELLNVTTTKKDEYREALLKHFIRANDLNPGNPVVVASIGFVYFQMQDCDRSVKYLSEVSGSPGLSREEQAAVQNCLKQCGY